MKKLTVTILSTAFKCLRLAHYQYRLKNPFPVLAMRRHFGDLVHAARAAYEKGGRSLERAEEAIEERSREALQRCNPFPPEDLAEAKAILRWIDERRRGREGRPVLIEEPLGAWIGANRLEARPDRLDDVGGELVLAEYKTGKTVDLEPVRAQFMILSYVISSVFGRPPARWEVELLGARRVIDDLEPETDPLKLELFVRDLALRVARGDADPRPFHESFCWKCPARSFCPAFCSRVGREPKPLARAAEPEVQLTLF